MYQIVHGDKEAAAYENAARYNQPLPRPMLDAPELEEGLELYLKGFTDLSTCRAYTGMGQGPIPWSAIALYCDRHGLGEDQSDDFTFVMRKIDAAYLKHVEATSKAGTPKPGGKNGTRS